MHDEQMTEQTTQQKTITCVRCESHIPGQAEPTCVGLHCHGFRHGCTCDACQSREQLWRTQGGDTMSQSEHYACVECGRPLADLTPCPDCDGTHIDVETDGRSRIVDYTVELARACRMSGLSPEQIEAFAINVLPSGRTRCTIWRWQGKHVAKYYFYMPLPREREEQDAR